jgi:hypothetical protein
MDTTVNPPNLVEFPSVPSFVDYFKEVSLTKYNSGLDITLTHPHPRPEVRITSLAKTGKEVVSGIIHVNLIADFSHTHRLQHICSNSIV